MKTGVVLVYGIWQWQNRFERWKKNKVTKHIHRTDNAWCASTLIQRDRHITVSQFVEELNISIGSAYNIVHEPSGYRKTCTHWVPSQLTDECKATRIELSLKHLMRYHRESFTFLHYILIGDEAWVHHVIYESKKTSMSWKHPSSSPCKKCKAMHFAKKIMDIGFWDHQGVLLVDFLTHGINVNAVSYCTALGWLREAIRHKQRGLLTIAFLLLPDCIQPQLCTICYSISGGRFWNTLLTVSNLYQVIIISLDL